MANDKKFVVKRGLATPNVDFANGGGTISATFLSTSNTLSFSGNTGQLFSITDSMSGTIFSVNDISGIPSIEVIDTGAVKLAETFGSVAIGANTIANYKFYVSGNTLLGNTTINNSLTLTNDKRLGFNTLNGNTVYMIQQNDDNFVLYTTTTTGAARPVFSVYANTNTSNLSVVIPLQLSSTIVANSSTGSAGQVLTSSGAGVYWGAAGAGANNATYLAGRTWETAGAIGSTVANTGAFTTLTSSGLTKIGQTVAQAAPSATDILSTAHASISGQGGNYLSFGQYDSGSGFAQWIQSSFTNPTTATYNIVLQPVGGNVAIGSATAPTKLYVNGHMSVANGFGIYANGTLGANGLVLTSNGTSLFWGSIAAAANATFATTANNALFANSASFVYGKQESQLSVANSAALQGATWQSPLGIGTVTANTGAFTTLTASANVNIDSGTLFTDATTNRVGIGTTTPPAILTVSYSPSASMPSLGAAATDFVVGPATSYGTMFGSTSSGWGYIQQQRFDGTATAYHLALQPNGGNVAIGSTTAPTRLFVNGHMSVANGFGIYANGVLGTNGFVLTSNGSSLYWSAANSNISSIANATFATTANNSLYVYGKQESQLSVANAVFATTANNSLFSNSASFVYGKQESQLSVANAVYAQSSNSANFANAAAWLGGFQSSYYTNATNISTGTLAEPRLPFRMDQNVRTTDSVTFANLTITGSVLVTGNVTTWSSNNLSITDNMIYLNSNSSVANPDLGFAANYNDGTYRHAGFFRDATDGVWKVFDQYLPEPDASPYINTANLSFRIADFQANVVNAASVVINNAQAYKQIDGTGTIRTLMTTLSDSSVIIGGYQGTTMINGVNGATYFYGSGAGSTVMTLTTGGNAGIGNTTPGQRLQVDGSVGIKNGLVANGTFGISGQVLTSNGTVSYWANTSAGGFTGNTVSANATIVKNQSYYVNAAAGWVNMTMPSSIATGDIFIVHSQTGNTRILNNSINIMDVGSGNDLVLESGQTVWVQAVNTSSVGVMFTYPAGGAAAVVANSSFATSANNSLYAYGKQESQLSVNNAITYLAGRTWETAGAIGSTVANTGTFTTLTASTISLNGNTTFNTSTFAINPTFKAYREAVGANTVSTASTVIDVSTFNVFNLSMTLNTTVSFTNPPASGTAYSFMLYCKQDGVGSRTITWPASVKWPNSSVPTMSTGANKIDVFNFFTLDGGTTYLGALSLANTG